MKYPKGIWEKYSIMTRRLKKKWLIPPSPTKHHSPPGTWRKHVTQYRNRSKLYPPCFRNMGGSNQKGLKKSTPAIQGVCTFEFCDLNVIITFLKVCIRYILGWFRKHPTLAMNLINKWNKQTKLSPFSFHDHVYHGFYSCCSDTWVLVTEVIPYNLLDISDS